MLYIKVKNFERKKKQPHFYSPNQAEKVIREIAEANKRSLPSDWKLTSVKVVKARRTTLLDLFRSDQRLACDKDRSPSSHLCPAIKES